MPFLPILGLAAFASAFSMRTVDPMLNVIADDFAVSVQRAALLASAFTFPYALTQLIFGPIGDAVGRVRLIRVTLACLAVAFVASTLAPTHDILLATRLISGGFAGGVIPVTFAIVGDRVAFDQRATALSRVLLAIVIGQLLGSSASGFIATFFGWRSVFAVCAAIAALAACGTIFGLNETHTREKLSLSNSLKRYGVVFENPLTWRVYTVAAIEGALTFGAFPMVAPLLNSHALGDALEAGIALGGFAIGGILYSLAVTPLVRLLGLGKMAGIGAVLVGLSFFGAAFGLNLPLVVAFFTVSGFGFYMIHNMLQILATELSPTARGSGVALYATSFFTGQALGAVAMAALAGWVGPQVVFLVAGVGMILLAFPASLLPPRKPAVPPVEETGG